MSSAFGITLGENADLNSHPAMHDGVSGTFARFGTHLRFDIVSSIPASLDLTAPQNGKGRPGDVSSSTPKPIESKTLAIGLFRMSTFHVKYKSKSSAMKTLHDLWSGVALPHLYQLHIGKPGGEHVFYSTDVSKAPVSIVVPCFIWIKIR